MGLPESRNAETEIPRSDWLTAMENRMATAEPQAHQKAASARKRRVLGGNPTVSQSLESTLYHKVVHR